MIKLGLGIDEEESQLVEDISADAEIPTLKGEGTEDASRME
jgi:hypothetical protein